MHHICIIVNKIIFIILLVNHMKLRLNFFAQVISLVNQNSYVCFLDGVLSYDMHQGERRGSELDLFDFTYDGILSSGYLSGGIGQLMDGEEGQSNFRLDPKNLGLRGYEWVGWKSETFGGNPVEITFKFDAVRNFSYVKLFCNNLFSREVRVFSSVKVFFRNDGQQYLAPPIDYDFARDELMEYAREVTIPLRNSVGRYVKLWLFFDSRWMMVSEIQFESGGFSYLSNHSHTNHHSTEQTSLEILQSATRIVSVGFILLVLHE